MALVATPLLILLTLAEVSSNITAEESDDPAIVSVLQRGEAVIASTYDGLYQASLNDKLWRRMNTPPLMAQGCRLIQQGPGSPLLAYYGHSTDCRETEDIGRGLSIEVPVFKKSEVLFISKDSGASWEQVRISQGHNIADVFIAPNGTLYICDFERSAFAIPSNVITGARVICSKDMGATWKDLTTNLPKDYTFHDILQDPDHPEQVCVIGQLDGFLSRPFVFQADDGTYKWQKKEVKDWHGGVAMKPLKRSLEDLPDLVTIVKSGEIVPARLSNFFTMSFPDANNQITSPDAASRGAVAR